MHQSHGEMDLDAFDFLAAIEAAPEASHRSRARSKSALTDRNGCR
jgi:hypothetical protein